MAKGKYERWLEPESLLLLEGWARDGATNEILAKKMGVSLTTLKDWQTKYPPISAAIKKGKEVVDIQVENALLKRALGYKTEEELVEKTETGETRIRRVRKEVPPDTGAAIFWLKNRRPDKWRDHPKDEDNRVMEQLDALLEEFRRATK